MMMTLMINLKIIKIPLLKRALMNLFRMIMDKSKNHKVQESQVVAPLNLHINNQ